MKKCHQMGIMKKCPIHQKWNCFPDFIAFLSTKSRINAIFPLNRHLKCPVGNTGPFPETLDVPKLCMREWEKQTFSEAPLLDTWRRNKRFFHFPIFLEEREIEMDPHSGNQPTPSSIRGCGGRRKSSPTRRND